MHDVKSILFALLLLLSCVKTCCILSDMSIWTFLACDSCPSGPLRRRYSPVTCHPLNVRLLLSLSVSLQAHQLDATKHYVRLKFLIENQVQFYIPKPEEDIYDLVGLELNSLSYPLVRCSFITFILLGHHTSSKHDFSSTLLLGLIAKPVFLSVAHKRRCFA